MAQHHRPTSRATVEESRARVAALGGISCIPRRISCIGLHLVSCIRRGTSCIRCVGTFMFSYDTFGITGCYLVALQVPSGSQRLRAPITFEALPVVLGASLFFRDAISGIGFLIFTLDQSLRLFSPRKNSARLWRAEFYYLKNASISGPAFRKSNFFDIF